MGNNGNMPPDVPVPGRTEIAVDDSGTVQVGAGPGRPRPRT